MRKTRVLQVVLSLSPGGTERLVIEICKRVAGKVDSTICCLDDPGQWAVELERIGMPVIALKRSPGFHPALGRQIASIVRERNIDVIHCHHYSPYIYGLLASRMTGARLIYTEHGRLNAGKVSPKRRLINPLLSVLPGRICAVSGDLKRHMVAEGFPARCIRVVYNGIDPGPRPTAADRHAARKALNLPHDAFVIGTAGRLVAVKRIEVLLQAHKRLVEKLPSARAVVIGDGPDRAPLEAAARDLGVAGSVTFAGYHENVRALMTAFDVYVNTSEYEGVSLTILEAMAAAIPVIATPVGGNPEVVIDHETGYLVGGGPHAIADALLSLVIDAGRRHVMGDAGRWRVKRHFSMERMVGEYASAYLGRNTHDATPAPADVPAAADTMSVSDATRSAV